MTIRNSRTYDNLLLLKDAGAITASGWAQVAAANRVLDMGVGNFEMAVHVDSSAVDRTDTNETYDVAIQGSNDITFGTPTDIAQLGGTKVTGSGRNTMYVFGQQNGVNYRYIRAYLTLAGTTPSINCTIHGHKL